VIALQALTSKMLAFPLELCNMVSRLETGWVKFVRSQILKVEEIASYFDTFGI
jgi:hypothetical protein